MNGKLNLTAIKRMLSGKVDHLNTFLTTDAEFTVSEIRDMMNALTDDMVAAANRNPLSVAVDLLKDGAYDESSGNFEAGAWWAIHKIHSIKLIRQLTGSGLKEAKDAFEQSLPVYFKAQAEKALRGLEAANRVAGYRNALYVSASVHHNAIDRDDSF